MTKLKELLAKIYNNQTLRRYVRSSVITFLSFFIPMCAFELNKMGVDNFEVAGLVGLMGVASRLVVKAVYETLIVLLTKKANLNDEMKVN